MPRTYVPFRAIGGGAPAALIAAAAVLGAAACGASGDGAAADVRAAPRDTVRVAVAANFAQPHDTIARRFTDATGIAVVATLGSTGQLYAQIEHGAPVDVFLAADTLRPALLERSGAAVRGSRFTYATGRLAIYAPALDDVVDSPRGLLAAAVRHVAVADSASAPYGAAALAVLRRWGVRAAVDARLVRGESIGQAYQFVASGAAEAGFVALSQVIREPRIRYFVVPDSLYPPIAQDAVVLSRAAANPGATRYTEFLRGLEGRAVIESFGYGVPGPHPSAAGR
ncbi:MAG: molybdate ABC transporter substrate-binding protein [Gemmatimonadota bacterium]|nr:molybdate ABC transporter substrate-binding protein [Gemmatimonadota bacterium]